MACEHLKKLHHYIKDNKIEVSSSDLIRVVCTQCDKKEDCISIK